ncbi:uncharacterized protein PHALS_11808 [Plasmopara halstedii]|uniref:Uncharacterized protein n=1 Tax=Plasmopara halstedii TaxID=4781 RepID=A0A0P1AJR3_PLAHL|nr:uncharacterized protein PHALS_11808 [Plasmopara halstedii]CEG41464.1 hypothetical protein PHALS_11808 [Plasmopara halstedii]|eukprot:XP_024577833.1 hypothetical protein PHALS_11808 [Plasmopara halstedii]
MIYISQSYFGIPKTIRINSQYVVLGRNLTQRDLAIICRDLPSDMPVREFIDLYKRITSKKMSTMMIERKIYQNKLNVISLLVPCIGQ